MQKKNDVRFMRLALQEAALAAAEGEIPVGAVIVRGDEVLAATHNLCERERDATAHAECLAISQACRKAGSWRLSDCTLYVTLEPCPMCMGAAINARLGRIVWGAKDARMGACGSLLSLASYPLEATPDCVGGVLSEECLAPLQSFFAEKRKKKVQ